MVEKAIGKVSFLKSQGVKEVKMTVSKEDRRLAQEVLDISNSIEKHSYVDVRITYSNGNFDVYFTEEGNYTTNRLDIQFGDRTIFVYCHFDPDIIVSDLLACIKQIENAFDEVEKSKVL